MLMSSRWVRNIWKSWVRKLSICKKWSKLWSRRSRFNCIGWRTKVKLAFGYNSYWYSSYRQIKNERWWNSPTCISVGILKITCDRLRYQYAHWEGRMIRHSWIIEPLLVEPLFRVSETTLTKPLLLRSFMVSLLTLNRLSLSRSDSAEPIGW